MMAASLNGSSRGKLDAFIGLVMAPVPGADVTDTQFNVLVRRARQTAWAKAEREVTYHKALYRAILWLPNDCRDFGDFLASRELPKREVCLRRLHAAVVTLLLTPAPRKFDLNWKKRQDLQYLPVDERVVAKAIAEDEAFLALHPTRVEKRRAA